MNKRLRNVKIILGVVGAIGLVMTVGSVGAVETDLISLQTGTFRAFVGVTVFGLCVLLNNWLDDAVRRANLRKAQAERRRQERERAASVAEALNSLKSYRAN